MLKGFKEFIMRGNIIDLGVAVVIGTAFTAVVTAVVTHLINPLIAAIGGSNVNGLAVTLVSGNNKTVMDFGAIITAIINFLVIAAVVYFAVVVPVKKIMDRHKKGKVEDDELTETELLTEIRDLLRTQNAR